MKQQMKRKFLAGVLSLCIVIGLLPATAPAAELDSQDMQPEAQVEAQRIDLVGQSEIVLDGVALGPVLFSHSAPPDCSSAHRMNFSFGTTMRLPTLSTGKPGSCITS